MKTCKNFANIWWETRFFLKKNQVGSFRCESRTTPQLWWEACWRVWHEKKRKKSCLSKRRQNSHQTNIESLKNRGHWIWWIHCEKIQIYNLSITLKEKHNFQQRKMCWAITNQQQAFWHLPRARTIYMKIQLISLVDPKASKCISLH